MKCCFCGAELKEWEEWGTPVGLSCPNSCKTRQILDKEIWQALIDGDKAQQGLSVAYGFIAFKAFMAEKEGLPDDKNVYKEVLGEINEITRGGPSITTGKDK